MYDSEEVRTPGRCEKAGARVFVLPARPPASALCRPAIFAASGLAAYAVRCPAPAALGFACLTARARFMPPGGVSCAPPRPRQPCDLPGQAARLCTAGPVFCFPPVLFRRNTPQNRNNGRLLLALGAFAHYNKQVRGSAPFGTAGPCVSLRAVSFAALRERNRETHERSKTLLHHHPHLLPQR